MFTHPRSGTLVGASLPESIHPLIPINPAATQHALPMGRHALIDGYLRRRLESLARAPGWPNPAGGRVVAKFYGSVTLAPHKNSRKFPTRC